MPRSSSGFKFISSKLRNVDEYFKHLSKRSQSHILSADLIPIGFDLFNVDIVEFFSE